MASKATIRAMEITNPKIHVGWQRGSPVFVAFSLETARVIFDEHEIPIVICVAVPRAVRAETYEQAVSFFSDDHVAATVADAIFGI